MNFRRIPTGSIPHRWQHQCPKEVRNRPKPQKWRARNGESRSRRDSQPSIACVRRGRTLLLGTGPSDFHQKRGAIRRSL